MIIFYSVPSLAETVQDLLALRVKVALCDLRQTVESHTQDGLAPRLQGQAGHQDQH